MMIHAFWAEMILASRPHSLERSIGPLSVAGVDLKPLDGYDKTKSFFDCISCEAVGVDVLADNMWIFMKF